MYRKGEFERVTKSMSVKLVQKDTWIKKEKEINCCFNILKRFRHSLFHQILSFKPTFFKNHVASYHLSCIPKRSISWFSPSWAVWRKVDRRIISGVWNFSLLIYVAKSQSSKHTNPDLKPEVFPFSSSLNRLYKKSQRTPENIEYEFRNLYPLHGRDWDFPHQKCRSRNAGPVSTVHLTLSGL